MKALCRLVWPSISKDYLFLLPLFFLLPSLEVNAQIRVSSKYEKKAAQMAENHFPGMGLRMETIPFPEDENHVIERLMAGDSLIGYMVFASAKGRYDYFDYLILTGNQLKIKEIVILEYRSDHGYQIASKRWLAQFIGYNGEEAYRPGQQVDAISGASLSSANLCDDLFQIMKRLRCINQL